jgi:hypothetical protein
MSVKENNGPACLMDSAKGCHLTAPGGLGYVVAFG